MSNDIKFIRDTKWGKDEVISHHRKYLKRTAKYADVGFLIIDDTMIEKRKMTKKMEGLIFHYSHSKGRSVYGHCIVSSHYRVGNISFPNDFKLYLNKSAAKKIKRPFKTKPEIACELIKTFEPFNKEKVYIITDSWYTSKNIVTAGKTKCYEVIGTLKSNRVFRFTEDGRKHKLRTYVSNLRNSSFEDISLNGEAFKVRRKTVYFNGIGKAVLLISKRMKDRSKRYILSTDMTLSNEEILRYYSCRWDIEVGYLYCKDRLGMGHYQMRKLKAIEKYCSLVFAACGMLEAIKVSNNEKSIGQSRRVFKIMKKREYVDRIITLSKKGVSRREIYRRLKLVA